MKTKVFSKYQKRFMASALAASTLLVTACGTGSTTNAISYNSAPGGFMPQGTPPAQAAALYGTYTSYLGLNDTMSGTQSGSQPATIIISPATVAGYSGTYVNMSLVSDGAIFGHAEFSSLLNTFQGSNGYETMWGFMSRSATVQNLSTPPVAPYQQDISFQIIIALTSGNQFDPSSSSISIVDNGLSQGAGGSTTYPYATFSGLVKQSQ